MSKKHEAKLRAYRKAKIERAEELKDQDKWVCIFTGQPIPDYLKGNEVEVHHLKGKDGDLYTDRKFFGFYVDRTKHNEYHDKPMSYLKKQHWWNGFMSRVKEIDYDLWYSLKLKEERAY